MKPCSYACHSAEHTVARRSFLGSLALGTGAVVGGLGSFAQPSVSAALAKDEKRMLVINMHGGLSQLESWDPKPGTDTGGPFRAIPTSVPGIHISELLPHTAKVMHHLALVRSINTKNDDHGKGSYMMLTGRRQMPGQTYPEIGAVVAKCLDTSDRTLPGHIRITAGGGGGLGFNLPPMTPVDFSKFGPVETQPLSRIKKLSGAFLHRNWLSIPHITQNDEADITELEAFRKSQGEEARKTGIKFTVLGFLIKAVVVALKEYPHFNASLAPDGESLILKQYFHIGVAVDTPNGLVVPVIRDADKKGLREIAKELGEVSSRMRDGKINPADLQGGCFSISSLGGLGGTHFTPIINAPEVAILGVGKAAMRPVWDGKQFVPRLMLPLSLSYDHRVIDGAQGARFIAFLGSVLSDIRRLVL